MNIQQIRILNYPSKNAMGQLMRISDFQESQTFKGKHFTWGECRKWWKKKGIDIDDYWDGMNIPVKSIHEFDAIFRDKNQHEQEICNMFRDVEEPAYVIVILRHDIATIAHELSHTFFWCDEHYREEVRWEICGIDFDAIKKGLHDQMGYPEETLQDEVVAYFIDGSSDIKKQLHIDIRPYKELTVNLRRIFTRYLNNILEGR
jgi:hypothetical protein